jgi:hypothetical protein
MEIIVKHLIKFTTLHLIRSLCRVVSLVTRLRVVRSITRIPTGMGYLSLHQNVPILFGFQPACYSMGTGSPFPRVKGSGREVDLSPQNNSKVINDSCHYFQSFCVLLCGGQGKFLILSAPLFS